MLWDLRLVIKARGYNKDEMEYFLAYNADRSLIFDTVWL